VEIMRKGVVSNKSLYIRERKGKRKGKSSIMWKSRTKKVGIKEEEI